MSIGQRWFLLGFVLALGAGWGVFPLTLYRAEEQPLQFSHRTHTGESLGLACTDCHALDEEGTFVGLPSTQRCLECHSTSLGESQEEGRFLTSYGETEEEIPWKVYARQPDNVWFPHAPHLLGAELECSECHGQHGDSQGLRALEVNRISGYSRDIWGPRLGGALWGPPQGMKMDRCIDCHAKRGGPEGCIACHR